MDLTEYKRNNQQALVDKINNASNVSLTLDDVNVSDPYLSSGSHNSAFRLEGRKDGKFNITGTKEIKFNRLDISTYFAQLKDMELLGKQEKTLHDLLPEINKQSGLYLTEFDVVNCPLPSILPRKPLAARYVTLEATPHSASFIGKAVLKLGPNLDTLTKSEQTIIFVFDKKALLPNDMLKAYTKEGEPWKLFNFLGNVKEIRSFTITTCRRSSNGYIHLYGNIDINTLTDDGTQVLAGTHLVVDFTGMALSVDAVALPSYIKAFENPSVQYTYYTDDDTKVLKRYDYNGNKDERFKPQFAFSIRDVIVTALNELYVISEPFESRDVNGTGALYTYSKVFRLKSSGSVDTAFKAITIRNEIGVTPFIDDIATDGKGNVYLYLNSITGYSASTLVPIVNGSKLDMPSWTDTTVSPVLKFDAYGTLDKTWVNSFSFLSSIIFNNVIELDPILVKRRLYVTENYLTLLQYKFNGITGKNTLNTTVFELSNGSYVLPKSSVLLDAVNWKALYTVENYINDHYLHIGTTRQTDNELLIANYKVDELKSVAVIPYKDSDKLFTIPISNIDGLDL